MDKRESIAILRQLADGIDPYTGAMLPVQSPFNHPQTVRALFHAIMVLEQAKETAPHEKGQPIHAGQSWERAEDEQLMEEFDSGMPIKDMAHQHQRTVGAIEARLARLGKVPSRDDARALVSSQNQ